MSSVPIVPCGGLVLGRRVIIAHSGIHLRGLVLGARIGAMLVRRRRVGRGVAITRRLDDNLPHRRRSQQRSSKSDGISGTHGNTSITIVSPRRTPPRWMEFHP